MDFLDKSTRFLGTSDTLRLFYKVREKPKDEADAPKEPLVMKIPIKHKQLCHHNAKRIAIKEVVN
jgi:hypothetical protein